MDTFPTGKSVIDPEKRLGIFLSYVGGNEFQSKTGHLAGVKKGSVCKIIEEVARALVARHKEYIKWPQPEEMRALADENNVKYGLPDLPLGVDGSLIRFARKPRKKECPQGLTRTSSSAARDFRHSTFKSLVTPTISSATSL